MPHAPLHEICEQGIKDWGDVMIPPPQNSEMSLTVVAVVAIFVEMEHIKKVANCRCVERHVRIAGIDNRIL